MSPDPALDAFAELHAERAIELRHTFADLQTGHDRPLGIESAGVQAKVAGIGFYSATWRLFKLADLEPAGEDYGQAVVYRGTVEQHPDALALDKHHTIATGEHFPVCGNTWRMLQDTRFAAHFEFIGNFDRHYGIFPGCGGALPYDMGETATGESPCC